MKNLTLLFACAALFVVSCKKSSTTQPVTNTPPPATSPYYFKFKLDTASYDLNTNFPQYMFLDANSIGGYQEGSFNLYPSIGLMLSWPYNDTVRESDVMGLIGKTLYFNDTLIHPELNFDLTLGVTDSATWYSIDTSNKNYNVKITNVVFLKKDTTIGIPVRVYVLTGTCSAVMYKGYNVKDTATLSSGSFNFIISRQDH